MSSKPKFEYVITAGHGRMVDLGVTSEKDARYAAAALKPGETLTMARAPEGCATGL